LGMETDPWVSGIGVFDMSEFAWSDGYKADAAPYETPQVIKDYYASEYKEPEWSNNALAPIFGKLRVTYSEFGTATNLSNRSLHCPAPEQYNCFRI